MIPCAGAAGCIHREEVYTVRAFPVSPGRWLRVEGKLLTEVPWFFAAPTGANKVTVYWDEVPGATGYRVR
jgi:hypothetical protein